MQLKRNVGTIGLLFSAVGGLVGSGWLFGPFYAAQFAGPAAILSWFIGGILMMFIAMTFAELATAMPVAGGTVQFAHFSHGPLVNFTLAWIAWLASVAVAPIETMALLQYASNYIPGLIYKASGTPLLTGTGILYAGIIMLIMCFINTFGIKLVTKTNAGIVVFKLAVPILTVVVLLHLSFHPSNFTHLQFAPYGLKGILQALPAAGVVFSFIGFSPAIQLAGESSNPQRTLPIAILGSVIICILLYVVIQTIFIGVINPADISHGWKHLQFQGDTGPFACIAAGLGAAWLVKILFIDAVVSPFGTAFIYTASTSRMSYAMSKNNYFPKSFSKLNRHGVPLIAIAINFVLGMMLYLPFPSWQNLVSFLVSGFVIAFAIGPIALLSLRKELPKLQRPFKLPYAKYTATFAFYVCNLIVYWSGWNIISHVLIMIVIGYGVFFIMNKVNKDIGNLQWQNAWWLIPYLSGLGVISYLGSFGGGKNIIPFGWDFAVIALFSIIICIFAVRASAKHQHDHEAANAINVNVSRSY